MKKLLLGLMLTILNSCQSVNQPVFVNNTQQAVQPVTIQSEKGMTDLIKYLVKLDFWVQDTNKDKLLTLEEFTPPESTVNNANNKNGQVFENFQQIDLNKDTRVSMDEALSQGKLFMSLYSAFTKESIRAQAREGFVKFDRNKDSYISKEEFSTALVNPTRPQDIAEARLYFTLADKNKNEKLSFGEFEDFEYIGFKNFFKDADWEYAHPAATPVAGIF